MKHACGKAYKDWLVNWRKGPTIGVRVADGTRYTSSSYASLPLRIETDEGPREIYIGEVIYIEEISNLLLSVGALSSKGVEFVIRGDTMQMTIPNGRVTVRKSEGINLYRLHVLPGSNENRSLLDLPNKEGDMSANEFHAISEKIQIWHDSLGHPGQKTFINLMALGKIPKFRHADVNCIISECDACNQAKARAHPTPKESEHTASEPLEQIHCDAVMINHQTVGGKKGFSLIVDEFTKFVDVRTITHKNETQVHIQDFVARMEAIGHTVK